MRPRECASALARHFGEGFSDDSFTLERGGRRVRVTVDSNSGMISAVVVTVYGPPLPEVSLARETSFDVLGKKLRIAREAQLGDPAFDAGVYVDSALDEPQLRWLLVSSTARAVILRLLRTCDTLALGGEGLVSRTLDETRFLHEPARLEAHIDDMLALYAALPKAASALRAGQRGPTPIFGVVILCATLATCLFASGLLAFGGAGLFSPFTLAAWGVVLGVAAFVPSMLLAAIALSGRASSFRRFAAFAIASFFLFVFAGPLVLLRMNVDLDASPVREHRVPIRRAYMEQSDEGEQLFIELVSPVAADETLTLGFAGSAVPPAGTVVYIKTRDGALGFPYRTEAFYGP